MLMLVAKSGAAGRQAVWSVAKREKRVFATGVPANHSAIRTRLMAAAVMTCCRRVLKADVAAAAQAATADGLCVRSLDPGTGGVAFPERCSLLVPARTLKRLETLARLQPDDARLALGTGAAGAQRAGCAIFPPRDCQEFRVRGPVH